MVSVTVTDDGVCDGVCDCTREGVCVCYYVITDCYYSPLLCYSARHCSIYTTCYYSCNPVTTAVTTVTTVFATTSSVIIQLSSLSWCQFVLREVNKVPYCVDGIFLTNIVLPEGLFFNSLLMLLHSLSPSPPPVLVEEDTGSSVILASLATVASI